jgi:hypothetical protein
MRYVISAVLVLLMLSSACSALSDQRKACVKACCENAGGVYGWEYNSCENSSQSTEEYECSVNCKDPPENKWCPIAALLAALPAAAFAMGRDRI